MLDQANKKARLKDIQNEKILSHEEIEFACDTFFAKAVLFFTFLTFFTCSSKSSFTYFTTLVS